MKKEKIMKKETKRIVIGALLCTLFLPMQIHAGGMNGNEQSVYSAASGTFTYEGQTYKAADAYLAQLSEYLNRDDIDLTAEQAASAIAEMNASVAEGVTQGYIVPTGETAPEGDVSTGTDTDAPDTNDTENSSNEGNTDTTTDPDPATENENGSASGENTSEVQGGAAQAPESSQTVNNSSIENGVKSAADTKGLTVNGISYEDISPAQEEQIKATLANMPEEKEAKLHLDYDIRTKTLTYTAEDGTVYNLPEDLNSKNFAGITSKVKTGSILMCALSAFCGILLLIFGCMRFQKKKPAYSNHKNRSILRNVTGVLLIAITAIDLTFFGITAVVETNYVNQANIMDTFADSGYYQTAHTSLQNDVHGILSAIGIKEDLCDEAISYQNFLFDAKNQMYIAINGDTPSTEFTKVQTGVSDAMKNAEIGGHAIGEENQMLLSTAVMTVYQTAAEDVFGRIIYNGGKVYRETMRTALILMGVSLLLAVLIFLAGGKYIHRGIRKIGYSFMTAGVLMGGLTIAFFAQEIFVNMHSTVESFYVFLQDYVSSGEIACYGTAIGMALMGGILYLISRSVRKHAH